MERLGKILMLGLLLIGARVVAQENILLIQPYDKDTIETKNPLLSWSYMDVSNGAGRAYYRLILVELKDDQSAAAGVIVNDPLIKMDDIKGTQLFYPYDAPKLKEGHRYGWQVQKVANNVVIDKSEAWEFTLPIPEIPTPVYYKMKVKNDGIVYEAIEGKLYLHFEEHYQEGELTFYLYDKNHELMDVDIVLNPEVEEEQEINVKKTGSNFYEVDLGEWASIGEYKLVVYDSKKRKYEMKYAVK